MESSITATHLAKHLSDILNRVRYRGEKFLVERNGEAIAMLIPPLPLGVPASELAKRLAEIEWPDDKYADDVESVRAELNIPIQPPEWPC